MGDGWDADVRWSYDGVAADYHRLLQGALDRLPVERAVLQMFADLMRRPATVVDVGCGTGEITRRLQAAGLDVAGVDVSPGMLRVALAQHRSCVFAAGTLHALPIASAAVDGLVCWYVLQHVPDGELAAALREARRVVRPGGSALFGFHSGTGTHEKTEGYGGHPMRVQVHRRTAAEVAGSVERAGFTVTTEIEARSRPGEGPAGGYVIAVAVDGVSPTDEPCPPPA